LELPIGSNEGAYDVALLNPNGAELFRTSATAKLEDHIVVLRADVDLAASLRVRISSACASQAWNGCDFLFACSEATTRQRSESLVENAVMIHDEHDFHKKSVLGIRSIIFVIVNRSSSAEVCDVHSRSLEASRSRVGIAEWDDIR
jgi:hypothetical protein